MESLSYSKKMIVRAIGAMVSILAILFLLSPFSSLHPLGYGIVWLFGYTGYYFLLPLLCVFGLFLLVKGASLKFGWRADLGVFFLVLALFFLFGLVSFKAFDLDLSSIFDSYNGAYSKSSLVYDARFAGGLPLTCLVALLAKPSFALPIVLIALFFLLGLFLISFRPFLLPFFHRLALSNSRKKSLEKSKKALGEDNHAPLKQRETMNEEGFEDSAFSGPFASNSTPIEERPLPSRSSRLSEARFSSSSLPKEVDSPYRDWEPSPEEKRVSGLVEARFKAPSEPKKQPTFERTATEEKTPATKDVPAQEPSFKEEASNVLAITDAPISGFASAKEEESLIPFAPPSSQPSKQSVLEEMPQEPSIEQSLSEPVTTTPNEASNEFFSEDTPSSIEAPHDLSDQDSPTDQMVVTSESEETSETPNVMPVLEEKEEETPIERESESLIPSTQSGSEGDHWTAPPAKPTKEQLLDHLGMPHKKPLKPYNFPPLDLLKDYPPSPEAEQEKMNCENRKNILDDVFRNFNIRAHVEDYTIGPSVTRYNIRLEPGYSVSNITRHITDIAISLQGIGIRFEEVVRGRSTSGLEVPNDHTTTVSLKRMVESLPNSQGSGLSIPFGVNIDNKPIFSDLSAFPHLLTAGTTGSGKSVFLTGIIMSLIMRNRPEDLKLVLVDPKRVEMALYHDLPHLLCPIIKEPSEAKVCLDKLIDEMERRYRAFEIAGVKDIREWNSEFVASSDYAKMPYIAVFIDEYADLSDNCKNVGDAVVRLAQKARAAGIHLVIATQRPSVSVITGTIKANIPVRVALSMSSVIDSQTIIGQGGAEELQGHGDMLVDCSLIARTGFTRCQGCFCDNHEINSVCDYIRNQMDPEYNSDFMDLVDHEAERKAQEALAPTMSKAEAKAQSYESMYERVKEVVMTMEYTSISKIQRQFGVGFPRAGKLFAQLQNEGIVAAAPETASSSKGCKVLVHADANEGSSIKLAGDNE